jgi:hypothetical protein
MPVSRVEPERVVEVLIEGTGVVLTIHGRLDADAGDALLRAAQAAVAEDAARLDIDLCSLDGFTDDGACALVACRSLCAELPEGLHYRTGQGPGRDALLAAYAEECPEE